VTSLSGFDRDCGDPEPTADGDKIDKILQNGFPHKSLDHESTDHEQAIATQVQPYPQRSDNLWD
jgi:TQXA domain-containing protein